MFVFDFTINRQLKLIHNVLLSTFNEVYTPSPNNYAEIENLSYKIDDESDSIYCVELSIRFGRWYDDKDKEYLNFNNTCTLELDLDVTCDELRVLFLNKLRHSN